MPPGGAGQVGGAQIFQEVLITGLGQQAAGHQGMALMAPGMTMRPRSEQQALNRRKVEGPD